MAGSIETKAMPKQEFNYLNFVFTTIPGGWVGGWPGGRVAGWVGGWVAGESGIKAISAFN